jgi:hypothetical protein
MCSDPPSIPYRSDPRFHIRLIGRWKNGGVVQVYFGGQLMVTFAIPAAEWTILAMLVAAAAMGRSTQSWANAFMTAADLARGLYERTRLGNSDPANITRFIFRLRSSIAKHMNGRIANPKDWSMRLIEHHRFLGYRIGLPPENLDLDMLGES